MLKDIYYYLGDFRTVILISLMNGFIGGYNGFYLYQIKNNMEDSFLISIIIGIFFAIINSLIWGFIFKILPIKLRPLLTIILILSSIIFSISIFKGLTQCIIINTVNLTEILETFNKKLI